MLNIRNSRYFHFCFLFLLMPQIVLAECFGLPYESDGIYCGSVSDYVENPLCEDHESSAIPSLPLRKSLCQSISATFQKKPCFLLDVYSLEERKICQAIQDGFYEEDCVKTPDDIAEKDESLFKICRLGIQLALHSDNGKLKAPFLAKSEEEGKDAKSSTKLEYASKELTDDKKLELAIKLQSALHEQGRTRALLRAKLKIPFSQALLGHLVEKVEEIKLEMLRRASQISRDTEILSYIEPVETEFILVRKIIPEMRDESLRVKVIFFKDGYILVYFPDFVIGRGAYKRVSIGLDYLTFVNSENAFLIAVAVSQLGDKALSGGDFDVTRGVLKHEFEVHRWLSKKLNTVTQLKRSFRIRKPGNEVYISLTSLYDDEMSLKNIGKAHFSYSQKLMFSIQALSGLLGIHGEGFAHRDIKQSNLFIKNFHSSGYEPSLFWGDFGTTIHQNEFIPSEYVPRYDYTTYQYLDPSLSEVLRRIKHPLTEFESSGVTIEDFQKADLWAAGLSLYQIFNGQWDVGCPKLIKRWHEVHVYGEFAQESQLCQFCNVFCDPLNEGGEVDTFIPAPGTLDSILYKMLHPDSKVRISAQEAFENLMLLQTSLSVGK